MYGFNSTPLTRSGHNTQEAGLALRAYTNSPLYTFPELISNVGEVWRWTGSVCVTDPKKSSLGNGSRLKVPYKLSTIVLRSTFSRDTPSLRGPIMHAGFIIYVDRRWVRYDRLAFSLTFWNHFGTYEFEVSIGFGLLSDRIFRLRNFRVLNSSRWRFHRSKWSDEIASPLNVVTSISSLCIIETDCVN